jgi:hypothetical protein
VHVAEPLDPSEGTLEELTAEAERRVEELRRPDGPPARLVGLILWTDRRTLVPTPVPDTGLQSSQAHDRLPELHRGDSGC